MRHRLHEALRHKSERFVAMEVFASATPFATHIFPLRHMASFGDISEMEVVDLARVLRTLLAKIYMGLENPDLNFTVRSGPAEYAGARHFHWYIGVIPRLTRVAGFVLGSGMFINAVLPEAAAEFLRKIAVDKVAGVGGRVGEVTAETEKFHMLRESCDYFLSPLRGLFPFFQSARGLRRGLHSFAASRLG